MEDDSNSDYDPWPPFDEAAPFARYDAIQQSVRQQLETITATMIASLRAGLASSAPRQYMEVIPSMSITQVEVDANLDCSICLDDFVIGAEANKLDCLVSV